MYYLIYETTNAITGKKYRGAHKTKNMDDNYLGSGKWLKRSINKHGHTTFSKEILFMAFSEKYMYEIERTEFVNEAWLALGPEKIYNFKRGGTGGFKSDMVSIHGKQIPKSDFDADPTLYGVAINKIPVIDIYGNTLQVDKNDIRIKLKELIPCFSKNGTVPVIDIDGNRTRVSKDEYKSGKYKHITTGTATVKDSDGNTFRVHTDDPRYISGELVGATKGISLNLNRFEFYDNNNILRLVCETGISKFIKENNLPSGAFRKSAKKGGTPIYMNLGSNEKRLSGNGLLKYKGWYCIKLGKAK